MDSNGLRQAEQRIWETICSATDLCEAVEVVEPWHKRATAVQIPVCRDGSGLLSWVPAPRLKEVRSIASGPVQGDRLQLIMIHTATRSTPVDLTLMVRSSWGRHGVPLTQALAYPEGIVLGADEAQEVLGMEADYYGLWLRDNEQNLRVLTFNAEGYSSAEVLELATNLADQSYQERYFRLGGLSDRCARHTRDYPLIKPPASRFMVVPLDQDPNLALTRTHTRLFKKHRVFEILNQQEPVFDHTGRTT